MVGTQGLRAGMTLKTSVSRAKSKFDGMGDDEDEDEDDEEEEDEDDDDEELKHMSKRKRQLVKAERARQRQHDLRGSVSSVGKNVRPGVECLNRCVFSYHPCDHGTRPSVDACDCLIASGQTVVVVQRKFIVLSQTRKRVSKMVHHGVESQVFQARHHWHYFGM
jgi:hypothetical protein